MNEYELIAKAKKGDESSFEALILCYKNKAYNLAFQYMRNEDDAYDMLQESFIKVYKNLRKFKGQSSFGTWLYRIVVNTCKDNLRKRKKHDITAPFEEIDEQRIVPEREENVPEREIDKKEMANELMKCMDLLEEKHKEMIILRDIQDFNYEEISEITNLPIGTVKSRINRARTNLRELWLEQNRKNEV